MWQQFNGFDIKLFGTKYMILLVIYGISFEWVWHDIINLLPIISDMEYL